MAKIINQDQGLLKFIHYGFPPNRLSYCGPKDSQAILDYLKAGKADEGLRQLILEYTGALPYLKFIARQNKIFDPLDARVVEAYWLGNQLLAQCDLKDFYADLRERYKKRVNAKTLKLLLGSVPAGVVPHHSFHVFQIFSQIGGWRGNVAVSLATVNQCLIRPGEIKLRIENEELRIKTKKLKIENNNIKFVPSLETIETLNSAQYQKGDWVAIHWNFGCEKISKSQQKNLAFWTNWNLARIDW